LPEAVQRIAEAVYVSGDFAAVPILADAMEEAGCTDQAILDHCPQLGKHMRHCWVVDLLLGKS
jgi:hypothetical protein